MTNPRRYLLRMFLFLLVIGAGSSALYEPLARAFMGNVAINGIILAALVIGILFSFRQILRLLPAHRWMAAVAKSPKKADSLDSPPMLATVAALLRDGSASVSAQAMRSVLDGVAIRLDESREISRYMIGLLVFLGLLGTFWGLLETVQAIGGVVGSIDTTTSNFDGMINQLKNGLDAPLGGMATAFSSSLFGLGGSLVLGFLDLQLGQASGRFYTDVEDWLSRSIRFRAGDGDGDADPALIGGLSEAAADKFGELARAVEAGESDRSDLAESLRDLTAKLAILADGRQENAALAERFATLEAALTSLAREMRNERKELNTTLAVELRALSKTVTQIQKSKKG